MFSLRSFLFGWSYFWRAFLILHIPYVFVSGMHKLAVEALTRGNANAGLIIICTMWPAYLVWAFFANGLILNQLQNSHDLLNKYSANKFVVGAKMVGALLLFALVFVLPACGINFVVSLLVGLGFGFHGISNAEILGGARVASYFVNSFLSVFALGYLAQRVIAHQLRKEKKEFVVPARTI